MFMVYKSIDVQSSKATESLACSRLSDSGEDLKVTGKRKVLFFFFMFALSLGGPDYLGY